MTYYINLNPASPVSRLVAALLGVLVVVGAIFFGLIVLAFVLGAGALLSLAMWVRARFFRHRVGFRPDGAGHGSGPRQSGETIEAEYTVISKRQD